MTCLIRMAPLCTLACCRCLRPSRLGAGAGCLSRNREWPTRRKLHTRQPPSVSARRAGLARRGDALLPHVAERFRPRADRCVYVRCFACPGQRGIAQTSSSTRLRHKFQSCPLGPAQDLRAAKPLRPSPPFCLHRPRQAPQMGCPTIGPRAIGMRESISGTLPRTYRLAQATGKWSPDLQE